MRILRTPGPKLGTRRNVATVLFAGLVRGYPTLHLVDTIDGTLADAVEEQLRKSAGKIEAAIKAGDRKRACQLADQAKSRALSSLNPNNGKRRQ